MIQLHYSPGTASMIPHVLLHEIGCPFELVLVDHTTQAHKTPAYLRLNPNGLLPALTDGELVLYETAAICLHVCDTHPLVHMAPPVASLQRAHFYKWLFWLSNSVQTSLLAYFYPQRWVFDGNAAGALEVQAQAQTRVGHLLDQLDAELACHGGPWLMGDAFTALDPYVFTLCRWTRNFSQRPARDLPHVGPYLQRVLARPATQRALIAEDISPPFV